MSREEYLGAQRASSATYDTSRTIARAHLDLASELSGRREALGYSIETTAERSGVSASRLEMIEEGDTTSLTEVMRLCQSLGLTLTIDDHLNVRGSEVVDTHVTIPERYNGVGRSTSSPAKFRQVHREPSVTVSGLSLTHAG